MDESDPLFDEAPPEVAIEAETVFGSVEEVEPAPPRELVLADQDLTPDQRKMFQDLLNEKMSLEERADQLVALAHLRGSKTAAVGLRAIMEVNRITRVSGDGATEAPAMFALPPGTNVSVTVEKVEK